MKAASTTDVSAHFEEYIDEVADGPIVVTRGGHPVAVLIAAGDDEDLERLLLAYNPRFRSIIEDAYESVNRDGGLGEDQFWAAVDARNEREGSQSAAQEE